VAMYELTAPHIKQALQNVIASPRKLAMVLDPGADPLTPGDEKEVDVVDDLRGGLGDRFSTAWALVSKGGKVTAAIFPSAYHIKLAVRDGTAFWLSSGNWKSSNQAGDLFDPQAVASGQAHPPAGLMTKHDRDWHVIVEEPGLAALFEEYIQHDLEIAAAHQASAVGGGVDGLGVDTGALPVVFYPPAASACTVVGAG